ncbi:MAG: ABC transporter permease [Sphaerochaetaceae bacterium]|nr:ABC transporter permease [Sphaerochaetaceae bacterium]MDC7237414.1 ABC transporter permease [Sphaerochaetaceae bacterium]MDC7249925.1 ABC transporter permease [Sphaerochaetaceae bacterium]
MLKKDNIFKRSFVGFCGPGKHQVLRISLFCLLLSLLGGAILLLLLGKNPLVAYKSLLQGSGLLPKGRYAGKKSQFTDFLNLLNYTVPMIFASLSVAVALKCGLFNICVSGIMVLSGFLATILVGYSDITSIVAKVLVILIGVGVGALMGALIGWLKYKFNMNEVVVAIMFNYIISYVASFFIQTRFVDPITRQSIEINDSARLTLVDVEMFNLRMNITTVFVLAILVIFALKFLLDKTRFGFELKAVGSNKKASRYSGIKVGSTIVRTMIISGALAGLAGVTYYLGSYASIQPRVVPSLGFDAIAVALLGNMSPIGCFFASFLVMIFESGTAYLSSRLGVLREIAALITSILLLFSASSGYFKLMANKFNTELLDIGGKNE